MAKIRSNSETNSFLSCQRKHYWAYRERIVPDGGSSKALTRGIVGHECLENYYIGKQKGWKASTIKRKMLEPLKQARLDFPDFEDEWVKLDQILPVYMMHYWDEPFKVLHVESQFETDLPGCTDLYGLRLDLVVEGTDGKYKGQVGIIDHKFVYQWMTTKVLKMNTQMPKYAASMRALGYPIKFALLSQIKHATSKKVGYTSESFRRSPVELKRQRMAYIVNEHVKVSNQISELSELTEEEHFAKATSNTGIDGCNKCAYSPLCNLIWDGQPTERTKLSLYVSNDYVKGYEDAAAATDGTDESL